MTTETAKFLTCHNSHKHNLITSENKKFPLRAGSHAHVVAI